MGTPGGLCRYDGTQMRFMGDSAIRAVDLVRTVVEDPKGNFWLGINRIPSFFERYSTVAYFLRTTERFVHLKEKTKEGWRPMKGQPLGLVGTRLWCISPSNQQLFYFDVVTRRKTVVLTQVPFFEDNDFYDHQSMFDGKRYLWIHLLEGILRFDTQTLESCYIFSKHPLNKLGKPTFFSHFKLTEEGIYAATKDFSGMLISNDLRTVKPTTKTQEFFAPHHSVVTFPKAVYPYYPHYKTFDDGVQWLWNFNYGYKLNPLIPKFQKITANTHEVPMKLSIRGFLVLNDSLLRVNLDDYQVLLYNKKANELFFPNPNDKLNSTGGRTFRSMDGNVWIMAKNRLCVYDPSRKTIRTFVNPDTLQNESKFANTIRSVFEATPTTLVLNTESGMFAFHRKSLTFQRIPFFGNNGRVCLHDKEGRFYVGFNGKLHIGYLRDTVWRATTAPITGAIFRNGYDDVAHNQVLGASATGLFVISKATWKVTKWTAKEGLASEYVYDVLVDKKGHFWISSARGISRIDPYHSKVENFKLTDGLQSNDFNSRTAYLAPDGEMFFGGSQGFNRFYPEDITKNTYLSKPYLTQLTVKESPYKLPVVISEATSITLPPDSNSFAIQYSVIDYMSEGVNSYQFRLLGSDSTWVNANKQTIARFIQVPAGKYVFELKAANSDGVWNPIPTRLKIEIRPYFWQTQWFKALLFLGMMVGLYFFDKYRVRQLLAQQRKEIKLMVQTQEIERNRFAKEVHDGIGANLTALRIMVGLLGNVDIAMLKTKLENVLETTFDDLRGLINDMSPRSLKIKGLVGVLRERAELINQTQKVYIIVNVSRKFPKYLAEEYEMNLYRIAQELLQNTLKHASATEVTFYLDYNNKNLLLNYIDNGQGFDLEKIKHTNGNGVANLYARTQLLNGTIEIYSAAEQGIEVTIKIPYDLAVEE
ncbi:sensor histidine kinase [Runella limosa]|uniref:sensor histidine kinase n=1 Tax=Runella limosa TaxID=370978 RepID=UPI001B7FD943|nr:triple tyrosine motif-containing protein [Runella limosa]